MRLQLLTLLTALSASGLAWGQTTYQQDDLVYTLYDDYAVVTGHSETLPTAITIPASVTYGDVEYPVTSVGNRVFFNCKIESVELPESITSLGDFSFASTNLQVLTIPTSVTTIGECAFRGCTSLRSIEIPASVSQIGGGAFTYCVPVTVSADHPYYMVSGGVLFNKDMTEILSYPMYGAREYAIPSTVTKIANWTFFDASLTKITIPSSVKEIGESVFIWNSFTEVELPSSLTTIGASAFQWCLWLQSIEIPSSVTSIGKYAFRYDSALEKASIPSSVTYLGDSAFEGCEALEEVELKAQITSIEYGVFRECKKLKEISIPPTVTSIGKSAFLQCESLTSVTLPPSVTHIKDFAFDKCTNLARLELSPNLIHITTPTFTNCEALTDVVYLTTAPISCLKNVFSDYTYERATLTVAEGGLEKASIVSPWRFFLNKKEELGTGVGMVNAPVSTKVYDTSGRYVGDTVDKLQPGIYVVNKNNTTSKILVK